MKSIATLTLTVLSSICTAQNYQPFNETSSKRFFEPGNQSNDDFFFHSTDSNITGDTLVINQYHTYGYTGDFNLVNGCNFWGSGAGIALDTTWLGNQVRWNSITKELLFKNQENEVLNFDFNSPLGSSTSFYSNGTVEYFIEHTTNVLENIYGVSDSVQIFEVQAYDNVGTPISSLLNNFEIRLSENHGLLSFINCYDFPSLEQGMELQGQTNPTIGNYQLTNDACYPWTTGDIIQYSTINSTGGVAAFHKNAYQTLTVTNRVETPDSVILYMSSLVQELNLPFPVSPYLMPSVPIRFKKGTSVSNRPWNMNQSDLLLATANEDEVFRCGSLPGFKSTETFNFLCDSCNCYGNYDGFGQSAAEVQFVDGLGIFRQTDTQYDYPFQGGRGFAEIIYTNINGVECGTLWTDIEELNEIEISIAPNPTNDVVKIQAEQSMKSVRVFDLSGRIIFSEEKISSNLTEISLVSFEKGAYILEIHFANSIQTRTILRE